MHIIALTTRLDTSFGGKQRVMLDICRGMHQRGHSISLLYLQPGDLLADYQAFCTMTTQVNISAIEKNAIFSTAVSFIADLWKILQQLPSLRPKKQTIVYLDEHQCGFLGYMLARLQRTPSVFHIHQPCLDKLPTKYAFGLKRLGHWIAVSRYTQESWQPFALAEGNSSVVYNGVDPHWFTPDSEHTHWKQALGLSPTVKLLSYIGRINQQKGIETLLRAFALIKQQNHDARLALVGWRTGQVNTRKPPTYQQNLEALIDALGIREQVLLVNFLRDPRWLYYASDVTVLPSRYPEPFGRTLIESMACGIPAIGSRRGGIPEVLTGEFSNALFPAEDEQALAKTINHWIDWRDRDPGLSDRCRQHVLDHFTVERMVDGVEKVLVDCLEKLG
jgi:glycosyltransferase involved in cell wall biosynthesis